MERAAHEEEVTVDAEEGEDLLVTEIAPGDEVVERGLGPPLRDEQVRAGEFAIDFGEFELAEVRQLLRALVPKATEHIEALHFRAEVQFAQGASLHRGEHPEGIRQPSEFRVEGDDDPEEAAQGTDLALEFLPGIRLHDLDGYFRSVAQGAAMDLPDGGGRGGGAIPGSQGGEQGGWSGLEKAAFDFAGRDGAGVFEETPQLPAFLEADEVGPDRIHLGDLDGEEAQTLDLGRADVLPGVEQGPEEAHVVPPAGHAAGSGERAAGDPAAGLWCRLSNGPARSTGANFTPNWSQTRFELIRADS